MEMVDAAWLELVDHLENAPEEPCADCTVELRVTKSGKMRKYTVLCDHHACQLRKQDGNRCKNRRLADAELCASHGCPVYFRGDQSAIQCGQPLVISDHGRYITCVRHADKNTELDDAGFRYPRRLIEPYLDPNYLEMLGVKPEKTQEAATVFQRMIAPTRRVVRRRPKADS
jgi:hypothetical protein